MDPLPTESNPGYYEVYQHENGKKYIVLEGLSIEDVHTPGVLEQFAHQNYATIAALYWILFCITLAYLFLHYIVLPLRSREDTSSST